MPKYRPIVDGMDASQTMQVFGPASDPDVTVALPDAFDGREFDRYIFEDR